MFYNIYTFIYNIKMFYKYKEFRGRLKPCSFLNRCVLNCLMRQFRTIERCVLCSLFTCWSPQVVPVKQRRVRRPGRVESVHGFVLVLQHHRHRRRRGGRARRQHAIGRHCPAGGPQTVGALRPEVRVVRAGRRYWNGRVPSGAARNGTTHAASANDTATYAGRYLIMKIICFSKNPVHRRIQSFGSTVITVFNLPDNRIRVIGLISGVGRSY